MSCRCNAPAPASCGGAQGQKPPFLDPPPCWLRIPSPRIILSRSRDAPWHPSWPRHGKRALPTFSLRKGGRRSADKRTTGVRPAAERKACQRMRRAPSLLSRNEAGGKAAAPSPFGAPPRSCAEGVTLRLGLGRASWNHRVQTGGPSPAPVQRAPRSPVKCRTGRCPEPPG